MTARIKSFLQVLISLAIGTFLIWFIYKDLTEADKANMMNAVKGANYWWIAGATLVAVISHIFRAFRWKYPLEALNIKIDMPNRFAAVMVGYLANLAFPRLGEVTRCAILARYKKQPFEQLFGTVIAERVVDAVILLALIIIATAFQFEILSDFLTETFNGIAGKQDAMVWMAVLAVVGLLLCFAAWKILRNSAHPLLLKIRDKITGLIDGFATIGRMKGQGWFYLNTLLIWASYMVMFMLTFQSFPETRDVPFGGQLASFVLGGIAIVAVQGGLGAYPLAIMLILALYGVPENVGYAFGWIVWLAQTIMIIVIGFLSMLAIPLLNPAKTDEEHGQNSPI